MDILIELPLSPCETDSAKGVRTGMMSVNGSGSAGVFGPFGGYKKSGIGRELGMHGLELYTQIKSIHIDLS